MTEKQAYLLKLIKEFDQICRDNDIRYSLAGGSMLGAVRHGGFIPWDDDMDVFMTLDQFNKLRAYFEEHQIPDRAFVHCWNNEQYPMLIARYYATDNTGIQRATAWGYMPAGQYIEIMLMIPVPSQPQQEKYLRAMSLCIELTNGFYADNKFRDKAFMRSYRFWKLATSILGRKKVLEHLQKQFLGYPEEQAEYFMLSHNLEADLIYQRHLVDQVQYVDFEDTQLPVPDHYMEMFWRGYGSTWRNLPLEEDRAEHQLFDDLDRPYQLYEQDYLRFVELQDVFKASKNYKEKSLVDGRKRREIYEPLTKYRCAVYALEFLEDFRKSGLDVLDELRRGHYEALYQLYEPYLRKQLSKDVRGRGGLIDVGEDHIFAACSLLIQYLGEYNSAKKIIALYKQNRKEIDPRIQQLSDQIEEIVALYRALDFGEWDTVRTMVEGKKDTLQADFCLGELELLTAEAETQEDFQTLLQQAKEGADQFPHLADVQWYVGFACEKLGLTEEARAAFEETAAHSRNGVLMSDAKRKLVNG